MVIGLRTAVRLQDPKGHPTAPPNSRFKVQGSRFKVRPPPRSFAAIRGYPRQNKLQNPISRFTLHVSRNTQHATRRTHHSTTPTLQHSIPPCASAFTPA